MTLNFLIALFIISGGILVLPNPALADSITYDPPTNKVTITGYTSDVPCTFDNIHTEDKAGTLDLWTGTPALNIVLTTQIKPTDEFALKIDFVLVGSGAGAGDTIDVTGTDKDGNVQSETLTTEADGTFTTTKWYKTITDVDCNGFNAGTLTIRQNQWGFTWKQGDDHFIIDTITFIRIGDDVIETWFADTGKFVTFTESASQSYGLIWVEKDSHFILGELVDDVKKVTKNGCHFYSPDIGYGKAFVKADNSSSIIYIYSSTFQSDVTHLRCATKMLRPGNRIWNSIFTGCGISDSYTGADVFNTQVYGTTAASHYDKATYDRFTAMGNSYALLVRYPMTVKNIYGRGNTKAVWAVSVVLEDIYVINGDFDNWIIKWSGASTKSIIRQYTFNLKVLDKDNNGIGGATVVLKDKDGNTAGQKGFSTTTSNEDATRGEIAEQTVSYGYYDQVNENTLQSYSPHTLTISHQDYPSREFKFTLDKEIDWTLALKDKPMSVGSIKVWGTEYADDEAGTIYAQVTYGDGSPCNTIDTTDITATVYKSDVDNTVIINAAQMTYVTNSNGIYKYNFSGGTFSAEGVYVIDVKVDSGPAPEPVITAYNSNEIHISQAANLIASSTPQYVWEYDTRTLTDYATSSIADAVWDETRADHIASGSFGQALQNIVPTALEIASSTWSYTGDALGTVNNAISKIWTWTNDLRKLSSRQIGADDYIAGVATSSTVAQVANEADQETVKYNVELVRKATFDFAGKADADSDTLHLVDEELNKYPDDHWNNYELIMMSGDNVGERRVVEDFVRSTYTITLTNAFDHAIGVDDEYVLSHEHSLIHKIWNWTGDIVGGVWNYTNTTGRTLTSLADVAGDVWSYGTRKLTHKELTEGGELATETYIDTATSTIIAEIDANEDLLDTLSSDLSGLSATTTLILDKWDVYTATDIIGYVNEVESSLGSSTDATSTASLFGRANLLKEKWGTQTAQGIYDTASSTLVVIQEVQTELGYNGTSTTAYADMQLVKGYVDELEGYVGTPSDAPSVSTLFGKIKDVREKLDQLDTLESELDTVDGLIDSIRASQQLDYRVELSDVGEVLETKTYRVKLSIWDYENNPANASSTPTITIYDAVRDMKVNTADMTLLSTGVYEYTYIVLDGASNGLWESIVSVDLGGATALTLNDYWEVEGSPARVVINNMSDITVPSISANTTISNEGSVGYEYHYEWCVVETQDNQCGGGDDIDYASAAEYIEAGEDYTTDLSLTVPDIGDYWFKVVVYWSSETSGASRTFTATEEEEEEVVPGSGGGVATPTANLTNIYDELIDISSKIKAIGGTKAYNLDDIYKISKANSTDLKYIANKSAELKAIIEVNKSLIGQVANKPIIQTWLTEGSIVLNILVMNPPDTARTVEVKEYLPKEIRAEHIIEIEKSLEIKYGSNLDSYYVSGKVELEAGERKIFEIEVEDIFVISEEELSALRGQAETLMESLKGTGYFAQASILGSEINADIDGILREQASRPSNVEKRISLFRKCLKNLQKIQENIKALKILVAEVSGKGGILGTLFGVSTTMTWAIIIIVVVGVAVLMILLYAILMRSRALEYYIADGKRLKVPPIIDIKKQAVKIKGGLITYFLPPLGRPIVDLQQLIKMIKILIIVSILVVLILLGIELIPRFF